MSGWMPIETAPREGERLLYFPAITDAPHPSNNRPALIRIDHGVGGPFRFATHWMPLPEPPGCLSEGDG